MNYLGCVRVNIMIYIDYTCVWNFHQLPVPTYTILSQNSFWLNCLSGCLHFQCYNMGSVFTENVMTVKLDGWCLAVSFKNSPGNSRYEWIQSFHQKVMGVSCIWEGEGFLLFQKWYAFYSLGEERKDHTTLSVYKIYKQVIITVIFRIWYPGARKCLLSHGLRCLFYYCGCLFT